MNCSCLKRIYDRDAAPPKVVFVSSGDGEAMNKSRCGDHTINIGQAPFQRNSAPSVGFLSRHRQGSSSKLLSDRVQPSFDGLGLRGVLSTLVFDASADFAKRENADEQLICGNSAHPLPDIWIASPAPPKLRNHIGVEQVGHQSSNEKCRALARPGTSKSSAVPSSESKCALKPSASDTGNASRSKPRASSSTLWPCAVARRWSSATISSGTSVTVRTDMAAPLAQEARDAQ